jgi:Domain of unknown function (DUF4426)
MKLLSLWLTLACSLLLSVNTAAQETFYKTFGDKKVHYSAFNSSFIAPEIASVYNISRGADKGLVNIAVVPQGSTNGVTALVGGTVNNLIAQQQKLEFTEIREGDAVYYLAPFTFDNEDPMTFTINVRPAGSNSSHKLTFQRTFYIDK